MVSLAHCNVFVSSGASAAPLSPGEIDLGPAWWLDCFHISLPSSVPAFIKADLRRQQTNLENKQTVSKPPFNPCCAPAISSGQHPTSLFSRKRGGLWKLFVGIFKLDVIPALPAAVFSVLMSCRICRLWGSAGFHTSSYQLEPDVGQCCACFSPLTMCWGLQCLALL